MLPTTTDVPSSAPARPGSPVAISLVARGHEVTVVDRQTEGQNTSRAAVVLPKPLAAAAGDPLAFGQVLGVLGRNSLIAVTEEVLPCPAPWMTGQLFELFE